MNASDWTRIKRAKSLATGPTAGGSRTGDYVAERRFGSGPIVYKELEIKPCCSPLSPNLLLAIEITFYAEPYLYLTSVTGTGSAAYSWDDGPLISFDPSNFGFSGTSTGSERNLKIYSESGFIFLTAIDSNANSIIFTNFFNITIINLSQNSGKSDCAYSTQGSGPNLLQSGLLLDKMINLTSLFCYNCGLSQIDITKNINLQILDIYNNPFTSLDLQYNTALQYVNITNCGLTALPDLHSMTNLTVLYCGENLFTTFIESNLPVSLVYLFINNKVYYNHV